MLDELKETRKKRANQDGLLTVSFNPDGYPISNQMAKIRKQGVADALEASNIAFSFG